MIFSNPRMIMQVTEPSSMSRRSCGTCVEIGQIATPGPQMFGIALHWQNTSCGGIIVPNMALPIPTTQFSTRCLNAPNAPTQEMPQVNSCKNLDVLYPSPISKKHIQLAIHVFDSIWYCLPLKPGFKCWEFGYLFKYQTFFPTPPNSWLSEPTSQWPAPQRQF